MVNYLSIGLLAIGILLLIGHFVAIKKSQK
ncbi:hypothetical protein HDF25_003700 [Pedobacter cryoconitis]|uniref:Uncharacterized protein n=1 Tax=Pedobacter cryoconitis TaxID=188932 RepID=A0A7X0J636_9SPHI|nr:hypothetical protein [Pedobacter cryoconitis]